MPPPFRVMQHLMHYLQVNVNAKDDEFSFCFEDSPYSVSSDVRADVIDSAKATFTAAYEKLSKYVVDGAQPAMPFSEQIRVLDPRNIVDSIATIIVSTAFRESVHHYHRLLRRGEVIFCV